MQVAAEEARLVATDTAVRVRIALIGTLLVFGVASIGVAAWSVARGGIGWDAVTDTQAALQARAVDPSWSLARAYGSVDETSELYGVFPQQLADVLHTATTGSTTPLAPEDAVTYDYQGAGNVILSVLSVTALAGALALAFRSLLAGAFAWSLTLATPLWLGMSHVDFKDVPLGAGLNLVTAGLLLSVTLEPPRRAALAGALLAAPGAAVALATRPGSVGLLAALLAGTPAVVAVWGIARRRPRVALPPLAASAAAAVCAVAFTWATNPIARIDFVQWVRDASDLARNFPWEGTIRTAGVDVRSTDLPWWYVPAWLGAQLPLVTSAALVAGLVVLARVAVRRRRDSRLLLPLLPLALQGIVLPVAIVAGGAVLYDGIRHLLFMLPALVALAGAALAVLDRDAPPGSRRRVALPAAAAVVVAASFAASARWAPYAYAFVNPVAGIEKHPEAWELDYWGVSGREGVERLRRRGFATVEVQPQPLVGFPYGGRRTTGPHGAGVGLYVFSRLKLHPADFGCTTIFTIERDGHVLGEGARCA